MNRFHGTRIVVSEKGNPLFGMTGRIVRRRMCDDGAWVEMAERPASAEHLFPFPANDPAKRGGEVLLYPEQCEPEPQSSGSTEPADSLIQKD